MSFYVQNLPGLQYLLNYYLQELLLHPVPETPLSIIFLEASILHTHYYLYVQVYTNSVLVMFTLQNEGRFVV